MCQTQGDSSIATNPSATSSLRPQRLALLHRAMNTTKGCTRQVEVEKPCPAAAGRSQGNPLRCSTVHNASPEPRHVLQHAERTFDLAGPVLAACGSMHLLSQLTDTRVQHATHLHSRSHDLEPLKVCQGGSSLLHNQLTAPRAGTPLALHICHTSTSATHHGPATAENTSHAAAGATETEERGRQRSLATPNTGRTTVQMKTRSTQSRSIITDSCS